MKRSGLERQFWLEAIDNFIRQHGRATPRWAIVCTYEIDLNRLARTLLPALSRRGRQFRAVVLSDAGILEQSLDRLLGQLPGAVNLHPVRLKRGGVFHPKLVLLRAGRHVRACFGSANVTDGGLGTNLEIWTDSQDAEVVAGLVRFLYELVQSPDLVVDDGARRSVRRALSGVDARSTRAIWSSLDESFARRIQSSHDRHAHRVTVISPLYASEGGLKTARAAIPAAEVHLYTDLPATVPNTTVHVYEPPHAADQPDDDPESFPRTLHAKAYVFQRRREGAASAWLGSANFTAQALTKSLAQGGNVEILVRTELPKDEVDALETDLRFLFKKRKGIDASPPLDTSAAPRPHATVVACELLGDGADRRLIVHAIVQQGDVALENQKYKGRQRRQVWVRIKNGQGVVEGTKLNALLDPSGACPIVLHQRLRGGSFPVIVNVPHVPPDSGAEASPQASLDALLDDLIGRVRVAPQVTGGDEDANDAPEKDDEGDDADSDDYGKQLDEVRHQGELDQLAVKAALLKRLVMRANASGSERESMLREYFPTLLNACPRHLHRVLEALFQNADSPESP